MSLHSLGSKELWIVLLKSKVSQFTIRSQFREYLVRCLHNALMLSWGIFGTVEFGDSVTGSSDVGDHVKLLHLLESLV